MTRHPNSTLKRVTITKQQHKNLQITMRYILFALLVFPLCLCAQPARIKPPTKPTSTTPTKPQKRVTQTVKAPYKDGILNVNGVQYKMVLVEGGTFQMGATSEQNDPHDDEKPIHSVTLSSYHIGQTEVTQALWQAVMGTNPSRFKGDNLPVERVSWEDCQTFITKLNQLTGQRFRLPTEAEWEYAARGGNKSNGYQYAGSNNLDAVAWYTSNSDSKTHLVATRQPNELGLYDMCGNVSEWCQDWYGGYSSSAVTNPTGPTSGSNRVSRGGCWFEGAKGSRVAFRMNYAPSYSGSDRGFRLCL